MRDIGGAVALAIVVLTVVGLIVYIGSCNGINDRTRETCKLRWAHAGNYADSLTAADKCGSTGQKRARS